MSTPDWERAEEFVADEYDLEHNPGDPGERWFDATNPRTGARYQVKTAEKGRRFRLWEDQHRSLTAAEGQNAAWYVFLSDGEMKRMRPSTVTRIIRERGGWNRADHADRDARQHKLPVDEVI